MKQQARVLAPPTPTKSLINTWFIWTQTERSSEDETCIERSEGQPVPKWFFLSGYRNKNCTNERVCSSVRYYDAVLIPVAYFYCSGYNNKDRCNELVDRAKGKMYAYYDKKPIKWRRIESPEEFTVPSQGPTKYFVDGFWVVIRNPKKGVHSLAVGLTSYDAWNDIPNLSCQNITYTLKVN
jgi:hypothetical protein